MIIRIPRFVVTAWDAFEAWGNVPVWLYEHPDWNGSKYTRPRLEVVRLDIVIAALFLFCTIWYGAWFGWIGAVQGGVMFIAIAALALFCRRGSP